MPNLSCKLNHLILIRHAHAEHLDGPLTGGWTDTNLTEQGKKEAEALATRLRYELQGESIKLYCSDLKRAVQTAAIIGDFVKVTPVPLSGLREINHGVATNMTREKAKKHYIEPTEPQLDWQAFPGAETWRQFYQRVSECMGTLPCEETITLIVSHGGPIVHIINWWLELDLETVSRVYYYTDPASITVLSTNRFNDKVISRLNDTAHLYELGQKTLLSN